jgi:folate-binding protein YgfZ
MAKPTPLLELHRANGAEPAEENGWILPSYFGAPLDEYRAVRSGVGILDMCDYTVISLTGPDRVSFLQGMVTNDVKKLAPGTGMSAAILDVSGKILADLRVLSTEDSFMLLLREPLAQTAVAHLNRYLVADDVEIAAPDTACGMISLQGPKARAVLGAIVPPGEIPQEMHSHRALRIGERELRAIRSTHTGEEGFDLLMELQSLASVVAQIQKAGAPFSLCWVGLQAQELLRVEAGIPRYGVDMDENTLFLEIGLDDAVSFHKGCYLGQEVVERIRSRGHVNRKLAAIVLEGSEAAARGATVESGGGREIGKITSSVLSPALERPVALGYVHRDFLVPGTAITVDNSGRKIAGRIAQLPLAPSLLRK